LGDSTGHGKYGLQQIIDSCQRGEVGMFPGSDVAVIGIAIIALGFFVWQAIAGNSKKDETAEGSAGKRPRRTRSTARNL